MSALLNTVWVSLRDSGLAGNPFWRWGLALLVAFATFHVLRKCRLRLTARFKTFTEKTKIRWDDAVADMLGRTRAFFTLAVALFVGSLLLKLSGKTTAVVRAVLVVSLLLQAGIWATALVRSLTGLWLTKEGEAPNQSVTGAITFFARLVVWSLILVLTLDNVGIDVNALIAGLGVTGIAVAMASQKILGDLFSSIIILVDRPFEIGDFIIVGDLMGTVEQIGLKTTRVRSLSGEQIVFGNGDLLASRIRNYKRMQTRRIEFRFGVTYETSREKLERIPSLVRETIEAQELATFERVHFKAFGDSALLFEVVYVMKLADYNKYMDTQHAINLALFRRFEEEGIAFAYPTQTLYVRRAEEVGAR